MLDRLSEVNWSGLHHAYGPADDVPHLLRALVEPGSASPSLRTEATRAGRELRQHVQWVLWGNVIHQGTRWQVTASVVPFLVEILRDGPNDAQLHQFLIAYLHHLAVGYPDALFPSTIDPEIEFRELAGMIDPGGAPDYNNDVLSRIWARDSYLAVEQAIETIAPFIHAPDDDTALETIALLASFPRSAGTTVPLLRNLARTRRDQRAGHAVVSLAQLAGAGALEVAERLVAADDRAVAIEAACAAVLADANRASNEAITILTSPIDDVAETRSVHAGSVTQLVGRCLARLPDHHRERAIDAIARQHRGATPLERVSLTASLLSVAFQRLPAPPSAGELTPLQRRAVDAIHDYGEFTIDHARFADYLLLLRDWGLPDSREALRAWLDGRNSTAKPESRPPWWKFWNSKR